ncbi:MAG: MFS transporter [Chloroflexi bacterium]|nr:MFS transporter [Chloroflexota bacterium]
MRLLRHPLFLAVALGHFTVDVLNGQTGVLLAVLSTPLGLSNQNLGLIATIYAIFGALSQPLFGWFSDRTGGRWTMAGGVLAMAVCFSLVALAPGWWAIVFLVIGALGSAAFHPTGANKATQVGYVHMAGQAATAASLFFLFGQGGLSLGPALGGFILDHFERSGLLLITLPSILISFLVAYQPRNMTPRPATPASHSPAGATLSRSSFIQLGVIMLVAGLHTWGQNATTTFAPKLFHDLGMSPTIYGVIIALFMGGSAVGGVLGGILADRWGRHQTITLALGLSVFSFYVLPVVSGAWLYLASFVAGFLNGAPHSTVVAMAQRVLPGRGGLASGVILGFMFTSGALGTALSGAVADRIGLTQALQGNALIMLIAMAISLALWLEVKPAARQNVTQETASD